MRNEGRNPSSRWLLWLPAIFFALLAGAAEVSIAAVQVAQHHLVFLSYDFAWMTPVAYLAFFLPCAVLMALGEKLLHRRVRFETAIGVFGFLAVFALLLPHEQVAYWASAVLAGGVAIQLARGAARSPERWSSWMRSGAIVLALMAAAAGAGTRVWRAVAERRAMAGLGEPDGSVPNILLIVLDTVRRSNLGVYGYARATTPSLNRRSLEGVVFDRAVATAPWTLPSHGSLFTGRSAGSLGGDWLKPLDAGPRTLAEVLRARGYVTGGFTANLMYTSWESGLTRGFVHYDDYPLTRSLVLLHSAIARTRVMANIIADHSPQGILRALRTFSLRPRRSPANVLRKASTVTDAFLAWQSTTGSRPYFAFMNYMDAHEPYSAAPESYSTRFEGSVPHAIDRYDGAIAWLDHEVSRLLDSLERRGVLDRTIVVVTADHGEQFGEHQLRSHGNSLYLPLLEVPLLIRYPAAVPAGTRVPALVSLVDLAATLLDLSGVPDSAGLPGTSLARYWRGGPAPEPVLALADVIKGINLDSIVPNHSGPMRSAFDERLHYIHNGWGREQLYAWRTDSLELHDLAGDTSALGDLVRMRAVVAAASRADSVLLGRRR